MEDCLSQAPQSNAATSPKESSPLTSKTPPHPQYSLFLPPERSRPSPRMFYPSAANQDDAPTADSQVARSLSCSKSHPQPWKSPHQLPLLHPNLAPSKQETPPPSRARLPPSKVHHFSPPSLLSSITIFSRITFNPSSGLDEPGRSHGFGTMLSPGEVV